MVDELREENVRLEQTLNEANDKITELENQLQHQHANENTKHEMTEDEARKLVYEYRKSKDPDNITRGYQY